MMIPVYSIATEYVQSPHTPLAREYGAFVSDTLSQYRLLLASGLRVIPVAGNPFTPSEQMFAEIKSGVLRVSTDDAVFGSNHPLASMSEYGVTINTAFRAVHDYFGHYRPSSPFETFHGELQAYKAHSAMYSELAIPALAGETIGQLCYHAITGQFVPVQYARLINPPDLNV
jgi:hypothetical protein